jgi:Flp pilus assembly protein TadG
MLTRDRCRDEGQLTLLIIGFVAIAAMLVVVGIDASKLFLARRALSSVADSAALAAAEAVDKNAIYTGSGGGCGNLLPLDESRAASLAGDTVADDETDLRHTFATLDAPDTVVVNGTVTVHLSGEVALPFGRIIAFLVPGHADGRAHVEAVSHAQSPLTEPGGC